MRNALLLTLFSVAPAMAETIEMVCENPGREYVVVFDTDQNTVYANDTLYQVLAVERTSDRFVVVGVTVNNGPTFRLHLHPYKKMELYVDNQLFQTDGCR